MMQKSKILSWLIFATMIQYLAYTEYELHSSRDSQLLLLPQQCSGLNDRTTNNKDLYKRIYL